MSFMDLGRTSERVLQNPRVKRSLGMHFGGGSIQSGDSHRDDSALPLSSSGVMSDIEESSQLLNGVQLLSGIQRFNN